MASCARSRPSVSGPSFRPSTASRVLLSAAEHCFDRCGLPRGLLVSGNDRTMKPGASRGVPFRPPQVSLGAEETMRSMRWTALVLATVLLGAPAASAAPREGGAGEAPAPLARLADWFGGVWRVAFGGDAAGGDRGAEIDPNGLAAPPGGGGASGGSGGGTQGQCSGECGPDIDPNG